MGKGLEKELDYLVAAKNNLWAAALGSFGGSLGVMIFPIPIFIKIIIMTIGFILSIGFLDNYFKKDDRIENIIKILNKKGE